MENTEIYSMLNDESNFHGSYYELSFQLNYVKTESSLFLLKKLFDCLNMPGPYDKSANVIDFENIVDNEMISLYSYAKIKDKHFPLTIWLITDNFSSRWIDICFSEGSIINDEPNLGMYEEINSFLYLLLQKCKHRFLIEIALIGEECGARFSISDFLIISPDALRNTNYQIFINNKYSDRLDNTDSKFQWLESE